MCPAIDVLLQSELCMICSAIDISAICEICVVILFLYAENLRAAEIHPELCVAIYGQNVMGEGTVRQ
jgi:hypothetical protein